MTRSREVKTGRFCKQGKEGKYNRKAVVLAAANYIVLTGSTLRDTAKIIGMSHTTVFNYVKYRLPKIDPQLYQKVQLVLEVNKSRFKNYKLKETKYALKNRQGRYN